MVEFSVVAKQPVCTMHLVRALLLLRKAFSNTKDFFIKCDAAQFVSHTGLFLASYFRQFISFHTGRQR